MIYFSPDQILVRAWAVASSDGDFTNGCLLMSPLTRRAAADLRAHWRPTALALQSLPTVFDQNL